LFIESGSGPQYTLCFLYTNYVERAKAEVVECACVIGVPEVKVMTQLL